jgi:predicted Zn-dependent protease with MMP-like domain
MTAKAMSRHDIIMNFATPPGIDDLMGMARAVLEALPDELIEICEDLDLCVEEFPDEALTQDLNLESEYDLLALYKSGKEVAPGVQKKVANGDDTLVIFRRPILDLWCETSDDLSNLVREIMIEEIARAHEFSDDDIRKMIKAHHQGLL